METEKLILVAVVGAIAIVGMVVGFAFVTFDGSGASTSPNSHSSAISDDQDLIDLSLQLPDWNLLMSDGELQSLEDLEGKFVLVDLMGTSCTSCKSQNTYLKELYSDFDGSLEIISLTVDTSETVARMAEYKSANDLPWPHGLDTNSVFSNYFNVVYIPTMIILDSDGYVRWKHVGLWALSSMSETLSLMMR